jgi:hypothetical protein
MRAAYMCADVHEALLQSLSSEIVGCASCFSVESWHAHLLAELRLLREQRQQAARTGSST